MPNPGFTVYASNRLELLAQKLAQVVRQPLSTMLDQEIVIVQSQGMARWLSMQMAEINGICANFFFPFPNAFLDYLCRKLLTDFSESRLFEPEILTLRIMEVLPECIQKPGYDVLRSYLADDAHSLKLLQLSQKIADLFDQYLIYRPQMISEWEQGHVQESPYEHWQADLWRKIIAGQENLHRSHTRNELLKKLKLPDLKDVAFPGRVAAFGISHLPLFHLQILEAVSKHTRVNLFLMNPCKEYWGDIVSDREINRIKKKYDGLGTPHMDLHLEKGNRLLASMGALGRDFITMISEIECDLIELFEKPSRGHVLAVIQTDILNLSDGNGGSHGTETAAAPAGKANDSKDSTPPEQGGDGTIQVHACHSPMREIEVLYDNILAMLDENSELMPNDILVMTPDIEIYAPFIDAVFGASRDADIRIPFSIADRAMIHESRIIEGFKAVLELNDSRLEAHRVMSLLEYPVIGGKFGLTEQDIPVLEEWVRNVNIRWGYDGETRAELGLPAFSENTWKAGIERLIMGYAMPGREQLMFADILPYDHIEGEQTLLLGRFLAFIERVIGIIEEFERSKLLHEWSGVFLSLVDQLFFIDESTEREIHWLRRFLERLATIEALSGFRRQIEFEAVKSYILHGLAKQAFGSGFISGGVTFCAMLPMRSIPFKVICLVGMNMDGFPRETRKLGFDLMARNPRPGDRSRRNDDKYLFLEAILSTREKLYISYIGRNIQDNTRMLPSVLVTELLDTIQERMDIPVEKMVMHHPLQAFSQTYFSPGGRFFSYSNDNYHAVKGSIQKVESKQFISTGLIIPPGDWKQVSFEKLIHFFRNPAKFLLRERMGIFLEDNREYLDDREMFRLEGLEKYLVEQALIHHLMEDLTHQDLKPILKAKGMLPHGEVGEYVFSTMSRDIKEHTDRINALLTYTKEEVSPFELTIDSFQLSGSIPGCYDGRLIHHRYPGKNPSDVLKIWLYHLIMCSLKDRDDFNDSRFIGKDKAVDFSYVDESETILTELLDLYWRGLVQPLNFFPATSHAFAEKKIRQARSREAALKAAAGKWKNEYNWAESDDPYLSLCFSHVDPLDEQFEAVAERVYEPFFAYSTEKKIDSLMN